jgi:hypothetical protein
MNAIVRRLTVPVVTAAVVTVVTAGVAVAWYQSSVRSTGAGGGTTVAAQTVTLSTTGAVSTGVYPGGPGADITISVTNPYATLPITLKSIAINGSIGIAGASGTCTTTGLAIAAPTQLPATINGGATLSLTLTSVVQMGLTADSGCQGATFTIPLQVTGRL